MPGKEESAPRYNLCRPQKPANSKHIGLFLVSFTLYQVVKKPGSEQLFRNVHFIFRSSLVSS